MLGIGVGPQICTRTVHTSTLTIRRFETFHGALIFDVQLGARCLDGGRGRACLGCDLGLFGHVAVSMQKDKIDSEHPRFGFGFRTVVFFLLFADNISLNLERELRFLESCHLSNLPQ